MKETTKIYNAIYRLIYDIFFINGKSLILVMHFPLSVSVLNNRAVHTQSRSADGVKGHQIPRLL